jgi:hypothetical protein
MTAANAIGDKSAVAHPSIHRSATPRRGSDTAERRPPLKSRRYYRKLKQPKTNRRYRSFGMAAMLSCGFGFLVAPALAYAGPKKVNPLDVHPQNCVQSNHITIAKALEMERKQDVAASQIQNKRLSTQAMFQGLPYVPSDAKIVSGFASYQVDFQTTTKLLPSPQSDDGAGNLPSEILHADCVVEMPDGSAWIVNHYYTGALFYINKEATEPYRW